LNAGQATPELFDDLAVAHHKVGENKRAIELMEEKERRWPGLYTTASNLGTFLILMGEFDRGLPHIDAALKIDPNAHFGREKYQSWLVEYAQSRRHADGTLPWPLDPVIDQDGSRKGFWSFLGRKKKSVYLSEADTHEAINAVLGMMRFAN